ncbi:anaphase-promoting complex subunit 4 [[Emmonsia] crescens]|uniref:Anaphase-promoting complex subunit 4 n=1 Tax=[Emmonsia] crescens TaxID=73230 RepID=A0A2B7ZFZ9_9EURO|nr:anaphase-promoting complex subunit 4 [Emmonsia crescens]
MDSSHILQLASVAEKTLASKCKPGSMAYCPTMDLVALTTVDERVDVFRLNGQRVFGGVYGEGGRGGGGGGEVRRIKWKGSGHLLAVVCSDNIIRILSAYSGKTVHQLPCGPSLASSSIASVPTSSPVSPVGPAPCVSCLGWGMNFTDGKSALKSLQDAEGRLTVDDLLSTEMQLSKIAQLKADLPRELAMLDMERSLPKLSTLPSTGNDDDVFGSRASIDSIFHATNKNTSDFVDVLLAGFDDGTIHLRIFDCFDVGSFHVGSSLGGSAAPKILLHSSHPISSTHSLLFSTENGLRLVTLDLRFITRSGRYLSLLASKITQLQNLLRYIKQVQAQIQLEWKNAQELPGRYIRNVTEDLQDKCACDFVTATYHLLVTGDCFQPLKEFLVDVLGERGHKRWEKAVTSGYEALRRLTHECLLPALERCGVLLSRLIGLSKFHKLSPILGLETTDLEKCQDTVDCLNLLSHKVLIHSSRELRGFAAFAKWLRHEVDIQAADPLSSTYEELTESSDSLDHGQTLSYIQGAMTRSALQDFIQPVPAQSSPDRWEPAGQDSSFYETYKKLLQQQDQKKWTDKIDMPLLGDLTSRLGLQSEKVFKQIAETQRRGILHRSPLSLGPDCSADVVDMTTNFGPFENSTYPSVYLASKSKSSSWILYLYRVIIETINGVSSTKATLFAAINLQRGNITQIKFVEDGTLMLLLSDPENTHLISFPYIPNPDASFHPNYIRLSNDSSETSATSASMPFMPSSAPVPAEQVTHLHLADPERHADFVRHTFPQQGGMEPVELQVNGRKGRRVVCVLYADGLRYSVFDMDSSGSGEEEEEEEEEEEDGDGEMEVED